MVNYAHFKQVLIYTSIAVLAIFIVLAMQDTFAAWAPPTSAPIGGNPEPPVNIGNITQKKTGVIGATQFLDIELGEAYWADPSGTSVFENLTIANNLAISNFIGCVALTTDIFGNVLCQTIGGVDPTGPAGETLRSNGTNWVSNNNLFNNGTNVGIGTTSPGGKLHVTDSASNVFSIIDSPLSARLSLGDTSSGKYFDIFSFADGDELRIEPSSGPPLWVSTPGILMSRAGNVMVGPTLLPSGLPAERLHVGGSIFMDGSAVGGDQARIIWDSAQPIMESLFQPMQIYVDITNSFGGNLLTLYRNGGHGSPSAENVFNINDNGALDINGKTVITGQQRFVGYIDPRTTNPPGLVSPTDNGRIWLCVDEPGGNAINYDCI